MGLGDKMRKSNVSMNGWVMLGRAKEKKTGYKSMVGRGK